VTTETTKEPTERLSEVSVEEGIDDGIDGRVEVSDPEQDRADYWRYITRSGAQRRCEVPCKER